MSEARRERIERSPSRFSGATRIGLRVAAVAGFAGAAWALSASAAHAAAAAPGAAPETDTVPLSSVTTLVSDLGGGTLDTLVGTSPAAGTSPHAITDTVLAPLGDALATTVTGHGSGVLAQVLAPAHTVLTHAGTVAARGAHTPPARHASDAVIGAVTTPVPATPSGAGHDAPGNDAGSVGSPQLVRTVTTLIAPLGLDRLVQPALDAVQPMIGMVDPLTAPLDDLLSPVTGLVCDVTAPVFDPLGALARPVTGLVMRSTGGLIQAATLVAGAPIRAFVADATSAEAVTGTVPVRIAPVATGSPAPAEPGTSTASPHNRSHITSAGRDNSPGGPVPAPAPLSGLGGISTTSSGSHEDHGGLAVLSAPIVNGSVAQPRLLTATGLAVRRHVDESPTVSPD